MNSNNNKINSNNCITIIKNSGSTSNSVRIRSNKKTLTSKVEDDDRGGADCTIYYPTTGSDSIGTTHTTRRRTKRYGNKSTRTTSISISSISNTAVRIQHYIIQLFKTSLEEKIASRQQQQRQQQETARRQLFLLQTDAMMSTASDKPQSTIVIPKFAYSELILGRLVGQGGFSEVTAITNVNLDEVYDTDNDQESARKEFAKIVQYTQEPLSHQYSQRSISSSMSSSSKYYKSKYVLKTLRNDLPEDDYQKGIVDLAIEYTILSTLRHPNIIQMRGIALSDPNRSQFFIIYDHLSQTLDNKFNEWRNQVTKNTGCCKCWVPFYGYCCSYNSIALHTIWKERFYAIRDICSAIVYLHSHNIIYRDLKPDNIGFENNDNNNNNNSDSTNTSSMTVKLFDFGLAKRIDHTVIKSQLDESCDDVYMLTGNTGSLRYMAPEVALDKPYNKSVDAYSFGILFWQICTLVTPYYKYTMKMHAERVVKGGERPKIDTTWPVDWTTLMQQCWSSTRQDRPTFIDIEKRLDEIIQDIEIEDGVVPTTTSSIRAKKKRKKLVPGSSQLDLNTRMSTITPISRNGTNSTIETVQLTGNSIV